MKKRILSQVFLLFPLTLLFGQYNPPDSIYIYDKNKEKDWYYAQKDVFCFNLIDDSELMTELPDFIDTVMTYSNSYSTFNMVCFSEESTEGERSGFVEMIMDLEEFNTLAMTINRNQEMYTNFNHFPTDDLIMITFLDPQLSDSVIDDFADNYNLLRVYTPSPTLPSAVSWTYIFQVKSAQSIEETTIYVSNLINETETELVYFAEPNVFSVVIPSTSNITNEDKTVKTKVKTLQEGLYLLETPDESRKELVLYSLEGKLIMNKVLHSKEIEIDMKNHPQGIYLLRLSDNKGYCFSTKLVY